MQGNRATRALTGSRIFLFVVLIVAVVAWRKREQRNQPACLGRCDLTWTVGSACLFSPGCSRRVESSASYVMSGVCVWLSLSHSHAGYCGPKQRSLWHHRSGIVRLLLRYTYGRGFLEPPPHNINFLFIEL